MNATAVFKLLRFICTAAGGGISRLERALYALDPCAPPLVVCNDDNAYVSADFITLLEEIDYYTVIILAGEHRDMILAHVSATRYACDIDITDDRVILASRGKTCVINLRET